MILYIYIKTKNTLEDDFFDGSPFKMDCSMKRYIPIRNDDCLFDLHCTTLFFLSFWCIFTEPGLPSLIEHPTVGCNHVFTMSPSHTQKKKHFCYFVCNFFI